MLKKLSAAAVSVSALVMLTASSCEDSDSIANRKQEEMSLQATQQVGLPSIINFQEKRMAKQILELRDQTISTTTYIIDLNGGLHKLCDSVGYGLPYATQFTNPERVDSYAHSITLPQADPNGLFMPPGADGTWVMCLDPKNPKAGVRPVYVEPRIITSPFPLG